MSIISAIVLSLLSMAAAGTDARLAQAVKSGDKAAVQTLLQQRVDVNAPETDGTTALHWAVRNADRTLVDALLAAGAKVNAPNRYGVTPLSLAAVGGDSAIGSPYFQTMGRGNS